MPVWSHNQVGWHCCYGKLLGKSRIFHGVNPDHDKVCIDVGGDMGLGKNFISHLLRRHTVISEKMEKEGTLLPFGTSRCGVQIGFPSNGL